MERSAPSRLANLKDLVQLFSLGVQIQGETAAVLEEFERRIYSLEEDRQRLISNYRALETKCNSFERRYSELLFKFSELKHDIKK